MLEQDLSVQILSDVTVFNKYAKHIEALNRRETWAEIVERNMQMHLDRFPKLRDEIAAAYRDYVLPKLVLPSMRSMQFAGKPIELNNSRLFNCSYLPIDHYKCFSEVMFLLLGGTGVGYSVQRHHIEQLPPIRKPLKNRRYVINDSIEGWSDAVNVLFKSYMLGKPEPRFIFDDIRPKGAKLVTSGGKAPGPQPLKDCLHNLKKILNSLPDGEQLTTLQVHDMCCYIADAVLAGGIRRAAMIAFFNINDEKMLTCKFGKWYELNPQRARANNSAVIIRSKITEDVFLDLWGKIQANGTGEPGVFFSNNPETLANPCIEIALKANQFCNLTTINKTNIVDQKDFLGRAKAAAFLGTLQASYTDFHYLRPSWQRATERDALLGVSSTGIASGHYKRLDIKEGALAILEENERVANLIGISKAARTTAIKPEGSASCLLGSSSGIHAWHDNYYIRRMGMKQNEALYQYLIRNHPYLIEADYFKPMEDGHFMVPQKAPEGAIIRPEESPIDLLERVKFYHNNWILPGHRKGENTHNVSVTVSIKEDEWDKVGAWMWSNKRFYNGIATIPFSGIDFKHMPFESIDEEKYEKMYSKLKAVDLTKVAEKEDETDLTGEIACSNGACEFI